MISREASKIPHNPLQHAEVPQVWAEIDLRLLHDNIRAIQRRVGSSVEIMAVVKSDAYGHGAVEITRHALACGVQRLAVAHPSEGAELRAHGIGAPILILGLTAPGDTEWVLRCGLTPTVCTMESAEAISCESQRLGVITPIHIRVDLGLGSIGLKPRDTVPFIRRVLMLPGLRLEGLYTHLPSAYREDDEAVMRDMREFHAIADELAAEGVRPAVLHAASSAAICRYSAETAFQLVRPGIMLYGLPVFASAAASEVKPLLALNARIGFVKNMEAGSTFGYGGALNRSQARIATLPIGYGDGPFLFHLKQGRGEVLIHGKRAPIIGKPLMDHMMVDITGIPEAGPGDVATLIGSQGTAFITASELASRCGIDEGHTDVITMLSRRVPRIYLK